MKSNWGFALLLVLGSIFVLFFNDYETPMFEHCMEVNTEVHGPDFALDQCQCVMNKFRAFNDMEKKRFYMSEMEEKILTETFLAESCLNSPSLALRVPKQQKPTWSKGFIEKSFSACVIEVEKLFSYHGGLKRSQSRQFCNCAISQAKTKFKAVEFDAESLSSPVMQQIFQNCLMSVDPE